MPKSSLKFKRRRYHRRKSIKKKSTKKLSKNMKRSRVNKSKRKNRRRTIRRLMVGGMEAAADPAPREGLEKLISDEKIRTLIDCLKSNIKGRLLDGEEKILFLKGNTKYVKTAFDDPRLITQMRAAHLILNDGDNIDGSKIDHFCNAFSIAGSETKLLSLNEELCDLDYNDKKALVNPAKRSEDTPVVPGVDNLEWFNPSSDHNTLWGILCTTAINEVCIEEDILPVCILLLSDDSSERNKETGALNREIKFWREFEHPNYVVPRRDSDDDTFVLVNR